MQSNATTPAEYIAALPPARRAAMSAATADVGAVAAERAWFASRAHARIA